MMLCILRSLSLINSSRLILRFPGDLDEVTREARMREVSDSFSLGAGPGPLVPGIGLSLSLELADCFLEPEDCDDRLRSSSKLNVQAPCSLSDGLEPPCALRMLCRRMRLRSDR